MNFQKDVLPVAVKWSKAVVFTLLDLIYNVGVVLLVVVLLRMFVVSPFHVSGSSMVPTLQHNDYILIDKFSYQMSEPEFEDIVVFTPPTPRLRSVAGAQCVVAKFAALTTSSEACVLPDYFIKRVIGVPGDTITIDQGQVYRNGEQLEEVYLSDTNQGRTFVPEHDQYKEYTVPEGKLFVLGDNRTGSSDSRAHAREWRDEDGNLDPFVRQEDISGKLLITLVSPFKIKQAFAQ